MNPGDKVIDGLGMRGVIDAITTGTPHDTIHIRYSDGRVTPWYAWAVTEEH